MGDSFTVKRSTPDHIHVLGEMLDTVYRPKLTPGEGMPKEFPHLFSKENAHNMYYVEDGGRPVSLVGVMKQEVVLQGVTIRVACIGCVATVPDYQGRHISSHILDTVIQDLTDEAIPLMLVSGDRGLYRRKHCIPVGEMYEAEIKRDEARALTKSVVQHSAAELREVPESERPQSARSLAPIYRAGAYRYRRTTEHMAVLLDALWFQRASHDQRLFELTRDGRVVGYVVAYVSSGAPDTVEVLEWAGSRSALLSSISTILDTYGATRLRLRIHREDLDLVSSIQAAQGEVKAVSLQGTFRVVDVNALFDSIQPLLIERFGGKAILKGTEGAWKVTMPHVERTFTTVEDITRFVFDHSDGCLGIPFVHTDDLNYI